MNPFQNPRRFVPRVELHPIVRLVIHANGEGRRLAPEADERLEDLVGGVAIAVLTGELDEAAEKREGLGLGHAAVPRRHHHLVFDAVEREVERVGEVERAVDLVGHLEQLVGVGEGAIVVALVAGGLVVRQEAHAGLGEADGVVVGPLLPGEHVDAVLVLQIGAEAEKRLPLVPALFAGERRPRGLGHAKRREPIGGLGHEQAVGIAGDTGRQERDRGEDHREPPTLHVAGHGNWGLRRWGAKMFGSGGRGPPG